MPLRVSDFDFHLPQELIAQQPLKRRDDARLLLVDPLSGLVSHRSVKDLPRVLRAGDLVIVNNSRVFPARLRGTTTRGAAAEILLLRPVSDWVWQALARPAKKLRVGTELEFGGGLVRGRVLEIAGRGKRVVELLCEQDLFETLERVGRTPLPPYIRREGEDLEARDRERYQTVFASERGSVAAPTAGLHFTPELLASLRDHGIGVAELTLHVGYGTFQPIRSTLVEEHSMDSEWFHIPESVVRAIERARAGGGRVVAVGSTTVRALESVAQVHGKVRPGSSTTDLFIYPGFRFRVVDVLLTNFHLPRSSLFLLVTAFGGTETVRRAYREAIQARYRFFSYGDCMLVHRASPESPKTLVPEPPGGS